MYFESIATIQLENITKHSAKENYFNSLLCQLAKNDIVQAKQSFEKYKELDYTFEGSPLGKLFEKIIKDVENINSNDLSLHLKEFDSYSRLDNIRVSLLLKIKQIINQSEIGENLL
jgi:alpha-soluble NSF attachment protein